jgi:tetratricopeptide (TPR) repeat protein
MNHRCRRRLIVINVVASLFLILAHDALTQQTARIEGMVRDSSGNPIAGVSVSLQGGGEKTSSSTESKADGSFQFSTIHPGRYTIKVEKSGFRAAEDSIQLSTGEMRRCEFRLPPSSQTPPSGSPPSTAIELDDRPNFTVAGITDTSGAGGHGSETRVRTGETLARQTVSLESDKPSETGASRPSDSQGLPSEIALRAALKQNPRSFQANHKLGEFYLHEQRCRDAVPLLETGYDIDPSQYRNALDLIVAYKACRELDRARGRATEMLARQNSGNKQEEAELRHVLGDVDEQLDDPLSAVREYERAAALDSSEQNYFAWGAELLLHYAAAPAIEVFGKGVRLHPESARMLAGLGTALYATGSADEAAEKLCSASDLNPANPTPYLFLGKMQEASTTALPCAEAKLARFAKEEPANASANYYYASALWKRTRGSDNSSSAHIEALLQKSVALNRNLDVAYLALGNLYSARGTLPQAVEAYGKAIAANPQNSDAHYGLGLAYKRTGENEKARREFERYKQLDQTEAATVDRHRRELRQFVFVLKDQTNPNQTSDRPRGPDSK